MKYGLPILLLTSIILINCDRYTKPVAPVEDTSFSDKLGSYALQLEESLVSGNIQPVMSYYADNYLHNGNTRESVQIFFSDIAEHSPDSIYISVHSIDRNNLSFSYDLFAVQSKQDSISVIIDTTIVEYTLEKEDDYLFIGNRESLEESPYKKVLVEVFTGTDCINCVFLKTALNSLKRELGNKFYYIEYHHRNELDFGNADIYSYYGVRTIPVGIIQGSTRIRGSSSVDDSYAEYRYVITSNMNDEASFSLIDFSYSVQEDSISFEVTVVWDDYEVQEFPERVQLKYALIEKMTAQNYYNDLPLNNVVIAKGSNPLVDMNRQVIKVSFKKPSYDFNRPAIILWLQTIPFPYNAADSKVKNVFEQRIIIPG